MLHNGMKAKGLSIHQLAKATRVGYERARTAVTGDYPPSPRLLEDICRVLELDLKAAQEMLITEQVKRKHGRVPLGLLGRDSSLQPVEELWRFLTQEEKEHIIWLVGRYAERRSSQQEAPIRRMGPRPIRTP